MAKTLYTNKSAWRKSVKVPQNVDASGSQYKIGTLASMLVQSGNPNANNFTTTDVEALAIAGMRWIATGVETPIISFVSAIETDKITWTTEEGQIDT